MKIIVLFAQITDPNLFLSLKKDGSGFETDGINQEPNPFDLVALEEALRLKAAHPGVHVTAVSCGDETVLKALRSALALGADRAVRVSGEGAVFDLLASFIKAEQPDLVLCGKQSAYDDLAETGPLVATALGLPFETCLSRLEACPDGFTVMKDSDGGQETLRLPMPCLVSVDLTMNTPRLANVMAVLKAKQKTIDVFKTSGTFQDKREIFSYLPPAPRPVCRMLDGMGDLKTEMEL